MESKYSTSLAKSNDFMKLINNEQELRKILNDEEMSVCQRIVTNKLFNGENFVATILEGGYEVIDDDNFKNVFHRCLDEWKEYFEEERHESQSQRYKQHTDEQLTILIHSMEEMIEQQPILISAMNKLTATDAFENLYNETIQYRNELEKNWNENKEKISDFIEGVIGETKETHSKVMVLPPLFDNGHTSNEGVRDIYFSRCRDNRPNHEIIELVYLTHESMHSQVLPYRREQDRRMRNNTHGLIQYLCDNELCSRLAEERGIAYHYGENREHGISKEDFANMYPFFVGYLYRNEENPVQCIAENMKKNPKYSAEKDANGNPIRQLYSPIAIVNFYRGRGNMSPYDLARVDFSRAIELFGDDKSKADKVANKKIDREE